MRLLPRSRPVRRRLVVLLAVLLLLAGGLWHMVKMPGRSYRGPLDPLTAEEVEIKAALVAHVHKLAGEIGERNVGRYESLEAAAAYIEQVFGDLGYSPAAQRFEATTGGLARSGRQWSVRNIEVGLAGSGPAKLAGEILIVGAHYDSVVGCPAANDNGSGVAAMLELARLLRGRPLERTVRFVAFVNEEPPFFRTRQMGSRVYARRCRQRNERIVGMFSLETIGYYSDRPGSQDYPFPLSVLYPATGNFIGFVGNTASRDLVRRSIGSFRRHTRFPSEGAAVPMLFWAASLSDHWSFWKESYPAVMLTDTAPFRYPYYHTAADTPDKLDYDRLARVTAGLARVVADLAQPPASPRPGP